MAQSDVELRRGELVIVMLILWAICFLCVDYSVPIFTQAFMHKTAELPWYLTALVAFVAPTRLCVVAALIAAIVAQIMFA
jgi:hypothetical protein